MIPGTKYESMYVYGSCWPAGRKTKKRKECYEIHLFLDFEIDNTTSSMDIDRKNEFVITSI